MDLLNFAIEFIDFDFILIEGLPMQTFSSKKEAEDFAENFKKLCNYADFPLEDYDFDFTIVTNGEYYCFANGNEDFRVA
jgi:hypothetical protein